jgi:hypothetical protein
VCVLCAFGVRLTWIQPNPGTDSVPDNPSDLNLKISK